jgi:hypothetical protein
VEHPRKAHAERFLKCEDLLVELIYGSVDIAGSTDNHRPDVYCGWPKAQNINDRKLVSRFAKIVNDLEKKRRGK